MTQMECLLCLELNEEIADCIQINSSNEQNIKNLIDKHLWPMESFKSKSPWLCLVCWEMLEDFHRFFKRIEDAHIYYECFAQCENESEDGGEVLINIQVENLDVPKEEINVTNVGDDEEFSGCMTYEGLDMPKIKDVHEKHHIEENNFEKDDFEKSIKEESTIEDSIEYIEVQDDIEEIEMEDDELNYYLTEDSNEADLVLKENLNHNEDLYTNNTEEEVEIEDDELNDYLTDDSNEPESTLKENLNHNEDVHSENTEGNSLASKKSKKTLRQKERTYNKEIGYEHDKLLAKHYEITCDLCKVPLETFQQLMKHFVETHNGTNAYTICCGNKYFSRASLVDHIKSHLDPDYFKCKYCSKILKCRSSLLNHTAWHDGKLYRCKICYKTYTNKSKFDKHTLVHDSDDKPPLRFPCAECDKTFRHKSGLKQHQHRIHQHRLLKLCTICGASFRDHDTFRRHMAKHEGKPSPTSYPCDICGLILSRKQCVKIHKELKHPEADKPVLTCNVCHTYKTTSGSKLKDHIRLAHTTERKHKCHICEKSFKERKKLKAHIGIHTGEPVYTCNWCPKTFYSSGNLSSHRIRYHAKEWEETKRKKYASKEHSIREQSSSIKNCLNK